MVKEISDKIKSAGIIGLIGLASCVPVTNVKPLFGAPNEIVYEEYELGGNYKGCKYRGECLKINESISRSTLYPHGRGTLYDRNGDVIRKGYWDLGQPVDEDPLGNRR